MVVKPNAAEINYFGEAQWSDRLPRLVQARLIETLERTGRFRAVSRPGSGLDPDYQVIADIRHFEVNAAAPAEAYISIAVRLVPASSGRSTAQRIFEKRIQLAHGVDAPNAAVALNVILGEVLSDIAQWVAAR